MISGVYIILNTINGKFYIGSSSNVLQRKNRHFRELRKNKHKNQVLQNAWNKSGEASFLFMVLEQDVIPSFLLEAEQKYLDRYWDAQVNCYNIAKEAGAPWRGKTFTEEHKRKIGLKSKGNKHSLGIKHSQETKDKMSLAKKGHKFRSGKKHTEETKKKMSKAHLGKKNSDETKEKKRVSKQKLMKPILAISPSGESVHYSSACEAARLTGFDRCLIRNAIKRNFKTKGITWEYV